MMAHRLRISALIPVLASGALALTGGPMMPEYTQFEEVNSANLVDPNTGNFTYTVPLLEVPGPAGSYPLAASYHAGITPGQEATWVGLGWSVNAGAINRVMRGLPDDYLNNVVTTRNVFSSEGNTVNASININAALGSFGMSMRWDGNSGKFLGATPYAARGLGVPMLSELASSAGLHATLTPGGASIGLGASAPFGVVNRTVYDSKEGPSGFKTSNRTGIGTLSASSGSSAGSAAGAGRMTSQTLGIGLPLQNFSLNIGWTQWQYKLDETSNDYMCGMLFQAGEMNPFVARMPATPYRYGQGSGPRQRFERSRQGNLLFMSGDLYQVSANGLGGSFEPYLAPQIVADVYKNPLIRDGNTGEQNNEGWQILEPWNTKDIVFRMIGDAGYNLEQNDHETSPHTPDLFLSQIGILRQYGSTRIEPIFETISGSLRWSRLKGFIMTTPDGDRYEYLQPVHTLFQADYVFNDPAKASTNRSEKIMPDKFAASWLLTSVKGADWVGIQNPPTGVPGDKDLGHWVKFNYTAPKVTTFSAPFEKNMPSERGDKVAGDGSKLYSKVYGQKELVYLSSISTKTHIAKFNLDTRLDSRLSWNNPRSDQNPDDGFLQPNELNDEFIESINTPVVPYSSSGQTSISFNWKVRFPGDWVYRCDNFARGYAKSFNDPTNEESRYQGFRKACFISNFKIEYNNGSDWVEHSSWLAANSCSYPYLNNYGDTEADCSTTNFNYYDRPIRKVTITNATINWLFIEHEGLRSGNLAQTQLLKSIDLYHRWDETNPLKTIEFKYNYSLCGNTPNSLSTPTHADLSKSYYVPGTISNGKLTLMKIAIKGRMADGVQPEMPPYQFTYQDGTGNPNYSDASYDEMKNDFWGQYSPTGTREHHLTKQVNTAPGGAVPNGGEMVGVSWNLVGIRLPTGGYIGINYKRDSYYLAGLGTDAVSSKQVALPDMFSMDAQTVSGTNILDVSVLPKLEFNSTSSTTLTSYPNQVVGSQLGYGSNQIPLKNPGPAGETDIVRVNAMSTNLDVGDFALVIYEMSEKSSASGATWAVKHRAVMNMVVVKSTNDGARTLELHPLIQARTVSGQMKFFVYSDFKVNAGLPLNYDYRFDYYLLPLYKGKREFYGGDIAVKDLTFKDGLGNEYITRYQYGLDYRKSNGIDNITSDFQTTSGSTYGLPGLYFDKFYRFWGADNDPKNLRFDTWPRFKWQPASHYAVWNDVATVTKAGSAVNPVADWVNKSYFSEFKPGGYFFPSPGVSYSRVSIEQVERIGSTLYAGRGTTENQFYNLAHKFLNESSAFIATDILAPYEYTEWTANTTASSLDVTAGSLAKAGKLIRSVVWPAGEQNQPVQVSEMVYSKDIGAGKLRQTHGSRIGELDPITGGITTPTKITMSKPFYHLWKETATKDGVKTEVVNNAYDFKSGRVISQTKTNTDGSTIKDIVVMEHTSPGFDLPAHNRLNLVKQERTEYNPPPGQTVSYPVIKAIHNIWSPIPRPPSVIQGSVPPLFKAKSLVYDPVLTESYVIAGGTAFQNPVFSNGKPQDPWRVLEDVEYLNQYSYPIERLNPYDGVSTAEYTGYGSNLVIGRMSGTRWQDASVFTGDYDLQELDAGKKYFDRATGWENHGTFAPESQPHCGTKSIYFFQSEGPTIRLPIDRTKVTKYVLSVHARPLSSATRVFIQPKNGNTSVGPMVYQDIGYEQNYTWRAVTVEIDLGNSVYDAATSLYAGVTLEPVESGQAYVDNLRIYPKGALVTTYFHDPAINKVISIVDESGIAKRFEYDGMSRMKARRNNARNMVSEATYEYISNAQ